jgi:hypothetical protein
MSIVEKFLRRLADNLKGRRIATLSGEFITQLAANSSNQSNRTNSQSILATHHHASLSHRLNTIFIALVLPNIHAKKNIANKTDKNFEKAEHAATISLAIAICLVVQKPLFIQHRCHTL